MKQRDQSAYSYESIFTQFSNYVERLLKKSLLCLFLILLMFQILLHNKVTAPYLSKVIQLEGTPLSPAFITENTGNKE